MFRRYDMRTECLPRNFKLAGATSSLICEIVRSVDDVGTKVARLYNPGQAPVGKPSSMASVSMFPVLLIMRTREGDC